MTLRELISVLKKIPQDDLFCEGFNNPHSYRGIHSELAVEPCGEVSVKEMINTLEEILDKTLCGYKGGKFEMHEDVDVYLSYHGNCGSRIDGIIITAQGYELFTQEGY